MARYSSWGLRAMARKVLRAASHDDPRAQALVDEVAIRTGLPHPEVVERIYAMAEVPHGNSSGGTA